MNEIWKDIPGYEGLYQASNLGRIKSLTIRNGTTIKPTERILKGWVAKKSKGYNSKKVCLCKDGIQKEMQVHQIVAKTFIENPRNLTEINHKDFNPLNNEVSNLEWCTHKENMEWSSKAGRMGKLSKADRQNIVKDYEENVSIEEISKKYGIVKASVHQILRNNGADYSKRKKGKYDLDLNKMLEDFKNGLSNKEIKEKYNCSKDIVSTRRYQFRKRGLLV